MRTTQATGNDKLVSLVTGAMVNASYGPDGSFLGPAATKNSLYSLFNQWNDDIGRPYRCSSRLLISIGAI